jgi:hypothetical protein
MTCHAPDPMPGSWSGCCMSIEKGDRTPIDGKHIAKIGASVG